MSILSSILFSISANLDNLTIGTAYGIKKVHINILTNLLIATVSFIGTILSMLVGEIIKNHIPIEFANIFGCIILIAIGLYFIIDYFKKLNERKKTVEDKKIKDKKKMSIGQAITISFALTINNLGLGIGASITGLNPLFTSILTFFVSLLTIFIGQKIGKTYLSKIFGKYSNLISGLLILILGVYEIFT